QLAVALDQVGARDQRRQVGLVGDVEENIGDADQQSHDVELVHGQDVEQGGHRHAGDQQQAGQVADDHDRPSLESVGVDAGDEAQNREGEKLEGRQGADL